MRRVALSFSLHSISMYRLENDVLRIAVVNHGAELQSLFDKRRGREYIWQRDPTYWAKSSPILFPFIGELKNGQYKYQDEVFNMSKHGFARDRTFQLIGQHADQLTFLLQTDKQSLKNYPFQFDFFVRYQLQQDRLSCTYEVCNKDKKDMFFSVGGHPALQLDMSDGQSIADYQLYFPEDRALKRYSLVEGLLQPQEKSVPLKSGQLPLEKHMFDQDAWVIKELVSEKISLRNSKGDYDVAFSFEDFPYFGIWSVPGAAFICLEPWCGVNDNKTHNGQLSEKEGIIRLKPLEQWSRTWSVAIK